jgi:hypothetical protein
MNLMSDKGSGRDQGVKIKYSERIEKFCRIPIPFKKERDRNIEG